MSEFLAEAKVLVRPDTTGFAATLKAELTTIAKANAITIPVLAGTAAGAATATRAAKDVAATQMAGGATAAKAAAQTTSFAHAQTLAATAAQKLTLAQTEVANAASAVGAAQITATRSTAASVAAQKALNAELRFGNIARIQAADLVLRLAAAQNLEASSALRAARAQTAHASSLGFVSRGAGATALSLAGVRGATLAANASFLAGAAALVVFAKSVGLAAKLEEELNVFRITAGATADEMERVSEAARALGADITLPAVSAGDAATAMTELAKAGLSVEDSIAGARGTLQLATAAQLDNATAVNITASALNAFGLSGEEAVHVADLLANAANEAQGGIGDMGASLASVASVSRQVGISLTDTVALLTLLAKNGIQGASGGTVLRVALLRLVAPSVAAAKIIERLGLRIRDAQGNIRPQVFADFAEATANLTAKQRDADAAIVFGTRGIRAQAILGREGAAALNEMAIAVEKEGTAAAVAGARTAGFSGAMEALKNSLATLGTNLGSFTLGPLTSLTQRASDAIGLLNRLAETAESFPALPAPDIPGVRRDAEREGEEGGSAFAEAFRSAVDNTLASFGVLSPAVKKKITADVRDVEEDIRTLFAIFQQQGGLASATSLNEFILALDKMADRFGKGDVEAQKLSRRIRELKKELQQPSSFILDVDLDFDESGARAKAAQAGVRTGDALVDALRATLGPAAARAIGFDFLTNVGEGGVAAAPAAGAKAGQAFKRSLGGELSIAEAAGTADAALLASLRGREKRDQAFFDRFNAIPNRTKAQQKTLEKAADQLNATRAAIKAILDKQAADVDSAARDAEKVASDITTANNKADQALLFALGGEQDRARNLILRAQGTRALKDDIKFAEQFRNILKGQIETVRTTVKDAQARASELRALTSQLIKAKADIRNLRRQAREAARQDRQDRLDRQDESVQLDIELAQITENRGAEIRAHNARIKILQQRIKNAKGNQLEIKRLKVEIVREKKALKELKGEVDDRGKAFAELTFSFLQQQQGFAANLLGNLIPGGATGGLVGGTSGAAGAAVTGLGVPLFNEDPTRGMEKEAAISGERERGVRPAQVETTNRLLQDIRQLLRLLNSRAGHPEAKHQHSTQTATMDVFGV